MIALQGTIASALVLSTGLASLTTPALLALLHAVSPATLTSH